MGIYTDYFAAVKVTDVTAPTDGTSRSGYRFLLERKTHHDVDLPADYVAADEVQTMTAHAATGGTFTLTLEDPRGETATTANIAMNASAATIETALDTAANGTLTGWTDGDISVSGGNANTNPVVFTYDGANVSETNPGDIVIDGALLTGGATGVMSTTTPGQPIRLGLAILGDLGVLRIDTLPGYKAAPVASNFTFFGPASVHPWAGQAVTEEIVQQVSYEEEQDYLPVIRAGFNW